jgi:hypothetical protein
MAQEKTIHINHTVKAIIYFFFGLILFVVVSGWIFFTYFYADFLNSYAIPKLEEAVVSATDGTYRLKLDRITYVHHKVYCTGFDLVRVRYDSGAKGIALRRLSVDTVEFTGVSILKIVLGKALAMTSIQMDSPKVYMTDLSLEKPTPTDLRADSAKIVTSAPKKLPVIAFDSIALRDIRLYLPGRFGPNDLPSYRGILFRLTDFYFNSETKQTQPVLFSRRADIAIPDVTYPIGNGTYSIHFKELRGNSEDSTIAADEFSYMPNYSEEAFNARQKFATPLISFRSTGMRIEGMSFVSSFNSGNIIFRKFSANSWDLDSYVDRRKPDDPHPTPAMLPNELVNALPVKIDIDSLVLANGKIRIRERVDGEVGSIGFDRTLIAVAPVSKDTVSKNYRQPSMVVMKALFLGEAPLALSASYPLHEKEFNMDIHATLGSFDAKKLNATLVPFVRLQATDGVLQSAKIDMSIRNGTATTTVVPVYRNFRITVLPQDPKTKSGLMEKLKTLAARIFVIENDNPDENGKLKTGSSTRSRAKEEAFVQFLWYALRKSLGQVIGGFQ